MNISKIYSNNISFRAYNQRSAVPDQNDPFLCEERNHKTAFARNYPTLEFCRNYISQNFPQGTNIAEFGCSQGQKCYSLAMMLEEFNSDKKYKIIGYDSEVPIADAKKGIYRVDCEHLDEIKLFEKNGNILNQQFHKFFKKYNNENDRHNSYYTPIQRKTKDIVAFQDGNILDIEGILKPKENGVIIFQNALYHIIKSESKNDMQAVKNLFKNINNQLPQNGIFVMGSLPADHLYDADCEGDTYLKYQKNNRIRIYDSSLIHEYLREAGFEPIFYERMPSQRMYYDYPDVCLPSVWKKVK